jgi:ParB family chromosome partitioning protein
VRADRLIEAHERAREDAPRRRGLQPAPAIARAAPPPGPRPDAPKVANVPLDRLRAHPRNVRQDLGDIRELTESIRQRGVLVPLMAERRGDMLRILHGHRRAAAAELAGLRKVPCLVVAEHTDADAILVMLDENENRRNLTPAERQRAVLALRDEFGMKMPEIAQRLGISESSAYRWSQGEDAAAVRGDRPARNPANPKTHGGRRVTRKPRIKADRVYDLLVRWQDAAPPELVEDLRSLLQGWEPDSGSSSASVVRLDEGGSS